MLTVNPSPIGPCKIKSTRHRGLLKILGDFQKMLKACVKFLWLCLLGIEKKCL